MSICQYLEDGKQAIKQQFDSGASVEEFSSEL